MSIFFISARAPPFRCPSAVGVQLRYCETRSPPRTFEYAIVARQSWRRIWLALYATNECVARAD
eukprot:9144433-Lingulodinium_polyedra.AAC.1